MGDARLQIEADLAIVPLAFVRAADGTLSAMHDTVRGGSLSESGGYTYVVPVFNPASEVTQVSRLRLINPGDAAASITIGARDDSGAVATGGDATLTLAAGGAQTLTAQQLEAGDSRITGRLGAGTGRWRLTVTSDRPLQVVNIVAASTGYWNNLSTTAIRGAAPTDHDAFTERFDGQNIVYANDAGTFTFASMDNDRFSETAEIDGVTTTYTGNYSYSAIGPDAGRLTLDYDDADRCRADFYFSSYTAGWFASHCTGSGYPADGTWSGGSWSVEDDEDTLPGMGSQPGDRTQTGSLGECYVSLSVGIGESCTYPGTTDAFSVNARGRGSFLTSLAGIRVRIDNETIDGRVYDFEASHQGDGVWRIDRIAGSTEAPETPPMTGGGGMVDGDDDDNDGVSNADDAFPQDPDESVDTDGDGIGNNADTDDDNDGVADSDDACPLDSDAACGQVSGPDLVVQSASVSDSTLNEGESFTFSATVRNQGAGQAVATTLRYYRSMDATIATGDTEVATDAVSALAASSTSDQSISLTAPSTAGTTITVLASIRCPENPILRTTVPRRCELPSALVRWRSRVSIWIRPMGLQEASRSPTADPMWLISWTTRSMHTNPRASAIRLPTSIWIRPMGAQRGSRSPTAGSMSLIPATIRFMRTNPRASAMRLPTSIWIRPMGTRAGSRSPTTSFTWLMPACLAQ